MTIIESTCTHLAMEVVGRVKVRIVWGVVCDGFEMVGLFNGCGKMLVRCCCNTIYPYQIDE